MKSVAKVTEFSPPFQIECEHIILREYRVEDLDEFHALTWQPEIYNDLPGWNVPKEQRLEWMVNYEIPENKQFLNAVSEGGNVGELRLRLGIILKETGAFIGWCNTGIKDELLPPNREIMYAISKDHRRKGYAAQAVNGLLNYLFENTDVEELNAIALVQNISSNKVIEKCKFNFQNTIEIDDELYHFYKLNKANWLKP